MQAAPVTKPTDRPSTPSRPTGSPAPQPASPRAPRQAQVPAIPSNQIYIASSSIDGHICVSSLIDPKDVTLRNFGRPLQAVALSPDYKNDRSFLSGGLAGELIITTGAPIGVKSNANTSSASQAAQGWLGAIGLGGHGGKDVILHSGEGTISAIKWSLSGKFVAWSNEHGIRIMRTNLHLDSADSESAWTRIGFIDKPNRRIWQEMAGVWKARIVWIDDRSLESDDDASLSENDSQAADKAEATFARHRLNQQSKSAKSKIEKLVIGWGDAAWIVHVQPGGAGVGKHVGERSVGSAEVVHLYAPQISAMLYSAHKSLVFDSMIVLFLAFRFIPLLYFSFLHIGHTTTMTILLLRKTLRLDAECTDELMAFNPSLNS